MTLITITTVGYREVKELTPAGKIFTIFVILIGTGTAAYTLVNVTEYALSGYILNLIGRTRMNRKLSSLNNHYIVCGFGRVGTEVAKEFIREKKKFVVIDDKEEVRICCEKENVLFILGDASKNDVLELAGINRARGLIAAVDSDVENLYITLTAKIMNPGIVVVARSDSEDNVEKLIKAGASRVINPASIGGKRMAEVMLHSTITDFLDIVTKGEKISTRLSEIEVRENSQLSKMTIKEIRHLYKPSLLMLGILSVDGTFKEPEDNLIPLPGERVIALGKPEHLERVSSLAEPLKS
jgi:voltage-gated potassium channel